MRIAAAGLLAAMACAIGGCGQLGAGYKGMRLVPPARVDQHAIERYPAGTPQRTILEWFGAVQQSEFQKAAAFYAGGLRIAPNVIKFERVYESPFFAKAQPPRIIGVSTGQTRATVFAVVEVRWSAPDGRGYVFRRPQAFELRWSRGSWQLADNYFLESASRLVLPPEPCLLC